MNTDLPKVKKSLYTLVIKRGLDILLSSIAMIVLSPLFIVLSILELIFHGKPIFFAQERSGLHCKMFKLYKFRSMTNERDENGDLLPSDQRLTPFGKLIRRFSLDELPELWCIFIGEMSIIGPRPLLPKYLSYYTNRHKMRHEMRPGLACVPLKPIKTWTWNDQFENDIWYIEHCSFWVDVRMLFGVAKEAFVGSEYRVDDTRVEFDGSNLYSNAKEVKTSESLSNSSAPR